PAVVTTLRSGGGCGVAAAWPNSENGLASDRVRDEGHRFGAWMDKEMGRRWFRARPSCPAKAGHPVSADVLSNAASVVLDHPFSWAMTGGRLMLQLGIHLERRLCLFCDLDERNIGREFDQRHAAGFLVDGENTKVGDYHIYDAGTGQRQRAIVQELRLILGSVLHNHHDLLDAGDEVHGAPHALDHLAWDHPIR